LHINIKKGESSFLTTKTYPVTSAMDRKQRLVFHSH